MSDTDNPFLAASGQRYLRGLFFETNYGSDKSTVVYTLKRRDHEGYPSLYRLYMEQDDPTEYTFAITCLDDWDHWVTLCECTWFKPFLNEWRRELEVRAKARALINIRAIANNPDAKEHYQASKFVLSAGWSDKPRGRGAGRPSKEDIKKEAQRLASETSNINDDFERIGLNS